MRKNKDKTNIEDKDSSNKNFKKEPDIRELTSDTVSLLDYYSKIVRFEKMFVSKPLHVDNLASKFASVYEKIRRVIDWKEEQLLRRTAIERSLKRRLISKLSGITFLQQVSPESIAQPFVLELIRGGYFPNDSIPSEKVKSVELVLKKYLHVLSYGLVADNVNPVDIKTKVQFYNWLLEIAACEIEEVLCPPLRESGIINFMSKILFERTEVSSDEDENVDKETIKLQTYIAVQKAIFNLDESIVTYNVLKYKYPLWITDSDEILEEFTNKIVDIWKELQTDLECEYNSRFFNLSERYDASYLILYDVLKKISEEDSSKENLISIFSDWSLLENKIKKAYDLRVSTLKSRLQRSAFYSTASMFLAGGVMLIFVEGPLAKLVHGSFNPIAMIVDLAIPSLMMLFLVLLIRLPNKKNYDVLSREVQNIVYKQSENIIYEINLKRKRNYLRNLIFGFFYLIGSIISFGAVFWIFKIAKVPWTSLYIDTANIAVVVFTALVIKQRSMEVTMEENAKLSDFFLDIFSIPLANLGRFFSDKWKEYNFVSVFFTAIVDIPIVTFVEMIEDWRNFLKEKKAGIH